MQYFSTIPAEVFDTIGIVGFGLYVLNYTLLTVQKVSSTQVRYFMLNLAAASMVMIGLMSAFNLAAALIQMFWIGISIVAIYIRLIKRHRQGQRTIAQRRDAFIAMTPTESQMGPLSGAQRRHDQRLQGGSLKTYYPGRVSEKRNPHRAMG